MLSVWGLTGSEEGKCFSYTGGNTAWSFWHHPVKQICLATLQHSLYNAHIVTWHEAAVSVELELRILNVVIWEGVFTLESITWDGCPKKAVHTTISLHVSEKHKHWLIFPEITNTPKIFPMLKQQSSWDGLFHEGPSSILKSSVIPGLCCTKGKSPGNFFSDASMFTSFKWVCLFACWEQWSFVWLGRGLNRKRVCLLSQSRSIYRFSPQWQLWAKIRQVSNTQSGHCFRYNN